MFPSWNVNAYQRRSNNVFDTAWTVFAACGISTRVKTCKRWQAQQDFSAGNGWRVTGGGWRVMGSGWRVVGDGWRVVGGGWRLTGDGWRVASGGLKIYMKYNIITRYSVIDNWYITVCCNFKIISKFMYSYVYRTPNKSIVLFCIIYLRGLFLFSQIWKKKTRNHACRNSHLS